MRVLLPLLVMLTFTSGALLRVQSLASKPLQLAGVLLLLLLLVGLRAGASRSSDLLLWLLLLLLLQVGPNMVVLDLVLSSPGARGKGPSSVGSRGR